MVARIANQRNDGGRPLIKDSCPFTVIGVLAIGGPPAFKRLAGIGKSFVRPTLNFSGDEEVQFQYLGVDLLLGIQSVLPAR